MSVADRHIVAMGGGGISDAVLAEVFALVPKPRPRMLYVGTGTAENPAQELAMYERTRGKAEVTPLHFFPWPAADLRELALGHDVIFVGGGNTANMLAIWRLHAFDAVLREAWDAGIVLTGGSAGMLCWFEAGITDSFGPQLAAMRDGLGFLPGSACPHYDDEEHRRPFYRRAIDEEGFPPGFAADASVGLHFVGTELAEVLTPREGATAYRVEPGSETPLPARRVT
jgi:peptidase E